MALIECVPNVSEGRRAEILDTLLDAIRRTRGARVLDVSRDVSHNRSVFTLAGEPAGLEPAILALFAGAIETIDLSLHQGVHPRVGAVDVVPFVPLGGTSMTACVELARRVGATVGQRFGIPVYLYEEAATDRTRTRLEIIRRGGLTGLTARIGTTGWVPDFGPSAPHPTAGISVIGARRVLVAYNVNLESDDLDLARQIAATIRESGGGLPYVKALGLRLDERGIVQVSMNLTNYEETSVPIAFNTVAAEAARLGVAVRDSEIVGLVPRAALAGRRPAELKLRGFSDEQILEERLARVTGP